MNTHIPRISRDFLVLNTSCSRTLEQVDAEWQSYFKSDTLDFVEHTSCNPVGLPHLGNLCLGLVGDLVFRLTGVKPSFYVNDLGLNFAKFLCVKEGHVVDRYGNTKDLDPELVESKRTNLWLEGLSVQDKALRDQMLNMIFTQLERYMIYTKFYMYYESSYQKEVLEYRLKHDNQLIRFYRDDGLPLYIASDFFYRIQVFQNFKSCLWVLGRDHQKYEKDLMKVIGEERGSYKASYIYVPSLVNALKQKLSKRKDVKVRLDLDPSFLKLYIWKNLQSGSLILQESRIHTKEAKNLLDCVDTEGSYDLLTPEERMSLNIWTGLKEVIWYIVYSKKFYKIYKLLERLKYLERTLDGNCKRVHQRLYKRLLTTLNLR